MTIRDTPEFFFYYKNLKLLRFWKVLLFVQTQFETAIKIIKSDNEIEFFMINFFINKGIVHQTSCVNTLQQNSIVERKHDHLLNVARTLMIQSHLPKIYWSYSMRHAADIINTLPHLF